MCVFEAYREDPGVCQFIVYQMGAVQSFSHGDDSARMSTLIGLPREVALSYSLSEHCFESLASFYI